MKWQKQYETDNERKTDQHKGFIACVVINLIISILTRSLRGVSLPELQMIIMLLPWIVNIGFLVLTLLFWPEVAVGYLVFLSVVLIGSVVLGILFVAACLIGLAAGIVFTPLGDIAEVALWIVFAISFIGGLIFLGSIFYKKFMKWWHGN
ncbi:MAG: hypothetical protein DWQ04_24150 [Chloroflexi bacterium]|nr:MAG: hypothetical protein DWQ04_24150 [Chloroflexota bacterium]